MKNLVVKIHEYNENSNSLIVSYASDISKKPIDEYPRYAIPVNMVGNVPLNELLDATALSGLSIVEKQNLSENETFDTEIISKVKEMVGKEIEFSVEDLKSKFGPKAE